MSVPVVIAGAGIVGCAVAHELAGRGFACTVVDPRPIGGGATQASAGMLAPHVEAHERGPLLDLGVRSLELYDGWIERVRRDSGMDVEYRRIGTLEIALDPQHASELQAQASAAPERRWLSARQASESYPIHGAIEGALFTSSHGYVAAHGLARALARAAEARGTMFLTSRVTRVARSAGHFLVETDKGRLEAAIVVLAAGAWSGAIQVDGATMPPVHPVRGQLLHLRIERRLDTILWGPECYIVPWLDGTILVGATVEDVGFDERVTTAGVRDLLDAACELLPQGWDASFLGARVGLRPATTDELPVIGLDPGVAGLVHATGHYRNGVLLAPITARLVADFAEGRASDRLLAPFSPSRFAS